MYYRYRTYEASLGRFWGRDPLGYDGGIGLYTYANNNPCAFNDPYGLGPNNSQKMSPGEFRELLNRYEKEMKEENPCITTAELISGLSAWMKRNKYSIYGKRYVYTRDGNWIDLLHFFSAARYGQSVGEVVTNILGWFNEVVQAIGWDESAHPFGGGEDLYSNAAGADFGDEYVNNAQSLADNVFGYMDVQLGGLQSPPIVVSTGNASTGSYSNSNAPQQLTQAELEAAFLPENRP